jgi:diguanylate cyclase (GGDEF)-like protein/PAS domain S-box-containing protein
MITTPPVRLLTVDDEEAIRSGVAAYFEDSGYLVAEASDGLAALELIRQQRPDIVITDLRMPRMDGLELIDAVTAEFHNLPIIVLSGTGVLADAIDALRRGAWDYLTKPIQDLAELEIIVQRSLERARLITDNQRYQTNLEALVTERTAELRKLFTAVEQSANSVVITDTEGVIEYANPRFCTVSGYSLPEVIGQKTSLTKSGYQPPELYAELWKNIRSGQEWRGEFRNKRKNGTLYWEMCSIAPIRNEAGELTHYVAIKEDITARKAQEEVLTWQASHDTLTGLHNRYYLESHLSSEIMRMNKKTQYLSLLLIDIDNLKFVNDTFGHDFGDHLLIEISKRLKQAACPHCLIARFLGDEFALIPPLSETQDQAGILADRVKEEILTLFDVDGAEIMITASIGVVTFPDDGENANNLLRNAEAAMYEAKRLGRNVIVPYTREFHKRTQHRLMLEARLHRALENDNFSLHYQPQICMKAGSVIGVEALLRWTPPDMPPVSPAEFIPILEETSLIVPVGTWVLYEACRQMVAWQQAGLTQMRLSVNISTVQFQRGDLAETVRLALAETGMKPSLLCLELTESILMIDTNHAQQKLQELRDLGVSLSLDDFGTGYSSLAYLSRLPVQELKVDQSFVCRLHDTPSDTAVVNTIIAMAQELNLELVAEGVETEAQLAHLKGRGCSTIQGFLFSQPLQAQHVESFIRELVMTPSCGSST